MIHDLQGIAVERRQKALSGQGRSAWSPCSKVAAKKRADADTVPGSFPDAL